MFIIAAFYHFFDFHDFVQHRQAIKEAMLCHSVQGSILIAAEGLNGTVAGPREGLDAFLTFLGTVIIKGPFEHKESFSEKNPFKRAKVRLKKETISLGEPVDPSLTGTYVSPEDWNALISDPDTIIIDARNDYEVHIGTFKNAIDPHTKNFKELPGFVRHTLSDAKKKKIATFCTGGIRCEKFTPWLKAEGYEEVYHLKGGILKYLEEIPASQSLWQGECYVFDGRVAVGHGLAPSTTASMCTACGHPLLAEDRDHPTYVESLSCRFCSED